MRSIDDPVMAVTKKVCVGCVRTFEDATIGIRLPGSEGLYGVCSICEQNFADWAKRQRQVMEDSRPVFLTAYSKMRR